MTTSRGKRPSLWPACLCSDIEWVATTTHGEVDRSPVPHWQTTRGSCAVRVRPGGLNRLPTGPMNCGHRPTRGFASALWHHWPGAFGIWAPCSAADDPSRAWCVPGLGASRDGWLGLAQTPAGLGAGLLHPVGVCLVQVVGEGRRGLVPGSRNIF